MVMEAVKHLIQRKVIWEDSYTEMVYMLLNYIHIFQTSNCIAYAQNLSYYHVHMRALKEKNVGACKYL